jgi:hypothetical protein
LVNHQRQQNSLITSKLKYNDKIAECDEAIVETWVEYFEDLATPVNQPTNVALMKSTKHSSHFAITTTFPVTATLLFPFPVVVLCLASQI